MTIVSTKAKADSRAALTQQTRYGVTRRVVDLRDVALALSGSTKAHRKETSTWTHGRLAQDDTPSVQEAGETRLVAAHIEPPSREVVLGCGHESEVGGKPGANDGIVGVAQKTLQIP
jgi:hypothetical protein